MRILAALLALCLPAFPAIGQQLPDIPTIQVPPGGTTVTGQVAAGGRNVYYVSAASLQALSVSVASPGNNVVFQVYGTGALVSGTATNAVIDG
ncbi:MAG: hypothetical protein Q8M19_20030 [Reyranella sp.]|nr:hypothetical protein [Reyranella sp.]